MPLPNAPWMKKLLDESISKHLKQEADKLLQEAKARQPLSYITEFEADAYLQDVLTGIGIRIPKASIDMHKRADGVWEMKRAKKFE